MKIREITPKEYQCIVGACPAVFQTDRGSILIVGRVLTEDERGRLPEIAVGKGEAVVEVPTGLLSKITSG